MKTLDNKKHWAKLIVAFALLSFFQVDILAQSYTLSINATQMDACPGDPLSFSAVASKNLVNPTYRWYLLEGETWKLSGVYGTNTFAWDMPDNDVSLKVECVSEGEPIVVSDVVTVNRAENCASKICHQTTTGEYYGGTDFNKTGDGAIDWSQEPPSNLEEFFSEQGIRFSGDNGINSSIKNQKDLGVDLYIDDSLGVNPNNSFYVVEGANASLFNIRFPRALFVDSYYRFTMRYYMILPETEYDEHGLPKPGCHYDPNMSIMARTGHGQATKDTMDIRVYDDKNNKLIAERTVYNSPDVARYKLWDDIRPYVDTSRVLRFEVVYFGFLPSSHSGEYTFNTYFEQFNNCITIAIDYISAEAQSVCVTPRSACIGDAITVNAAGFPRSANYLWQRYSDNTYTTVVPWTENEVTYRYDQFGKPSQADIVMKEAGAFYYTVSNGGSDPVYFSLVGRDCKVVGPGIDGNKNVCITEFPYEQTYSPRDPSIVDWLGEYGKDYIFKWKIEPSVPVTTPTNIEVIESENGQKATVRVNENPLTSDKFTPDQPYRLILGVHNINGNTVAAKPSGADTITLWVYDKPNVSRLNFVTRRGEDSICAATSSDTIILQNKEDIAGYVWNFTGATMDANGVIHLNGYNKGALCNSTNANFPVALEVVNNVCKSEIKDTFYVQSTDDPTINCDKLSSPNTYELRSSQLDTLIYLPIPEYATSCDDDPALNVVISYRGAEPIHNLDSTFVLHNAQISDKENLKFNLFAGKGTVKYDLVDGCGKHATCQIDLTVVDTTRPRINCDEIDSYHVSITKEDGCEAKPGTHPQLPNLEPKPLRDLTFTDTVIIIEGKYAGRSEVNPEEDPGLDPSKYSTSVDLNAPYKKGVTYILWKYEDPSGLASYCHSSVTVVNEGDVFKCESLEDIRTSVNESKVGLQYHYASAMAQKTPNPDTKYMLADVLKVPTPNASYCGEVKLDILITGECIDDNGDVIAVAVDSLVSDADFLKHKFPVGLTEITYRFVTDNDTVRGKKDTLICGQKVIVASKDAPEPNDCPKDTTLYVDDDCLVKWNITLNQVPTATIPYFKEVKYIYDNCSGGSSYDYNSLGMSAELSKTYDTLGYPYMVRRYSFLDENWKSIKDSTVVSDCENVFAENDNVPVKEVHHRNPDKSICKKDEIEKMKLKVNNFTELPACVTDPFGKGRHIVVWYFDNGKGVLDSCVTKFTVLDTIPPTKDCGKWGEESFFYCDTTCVVPSEKVALRIPNVDSLNVSDNCSDPSHIKIEWVRKFEGANVPTLEADYPLGKTTITWIVTDESNNSSECVQTITVLDTLPPFFDCKSLKPITAYANENCEAPADSVVTDKSTPRAKDDPCSPTGDSIKAVGVRHIMINGAWTPDGKNLYTDSYPKGETLIIWTFEDAAQNKAQCEQLVTVIDTIPPFVPDCGDLDPIVIELDADSCAASEEYVRKNLGTREGTDNCDGKIIGVPMMTLADSSYIDLPEFFKKDTVYLISWVFTDNEGNTKVCYQSLEVKDVTPPTPHNCQDPTKTVYATVECSVDYNALGLENPTVDDPCDGILYPKVIARVKQKDGSVIVYTDDELLTARYPVGTHDFVWIYTDKAGLQDSCNMALTVADSVDLVLSDCDIDKMKIVTLPKGECSLPASELEAHMKFPTAYDMCDEEYVIPRVERRFNGELVVDANGMPIAWDSQDFPLGRTDIRWIFVDKLGVMKDSCEKTLIVKTELFDCSVLADTITVNLLEKFYATADEVRLAGLKEPQIEIDTCNAATLSFSRSDNLSMTDDYQIGLTKVYWTFDYVFGDQKVCTQVVDIQDMVPPVLICPELTNTTYECYGEIPTPYQTFEEFQAAGGSISEIQKYKPGSFGYKEREQGSAPCDYHLIRTYFVEDVRDSLITCDQEFIIHDVTAPVISTTLDTLTVACDQEIPSPDLIEISVTDNCTAVDKIKIDYSETNNRSSDPRSCDYNSYKIWRTWKAIDSCGNVSAPLVQVVMIVDTTAPKFTLPDNWRDTVLANNVKNCEMEMPILTDLLKDHVTDGCTEPDDIRIWQVPSAGVKLKETTTVHIYAADLCGNKDSVKLVVFVDKVENIVSLEATSLVLCGSDTSSVNLMSQEVRFAVGKVHYDDESSDEFQTAPSVFRYDCYKESISEQTLVYSNNPRTYAHKFAHPDNAVRDSIYKSRVNLRKKAQTGLYYFVVEDTITQCKDTASAYLTINERPRLAMLCDTFYHCENDTLDVDDLYFEHDVCLDAMGLDITKTGWVINGVDYEEGTPLPYVGKPQTMYYFAENECGRTTTYDSYFTYCADSTPKTKHDSLMLVGSERDLELWRKDELHSKDSIVFIINRRYSSDSIFLAPLSELPSNSIWVGDEVTFKVSTPYNPSFYIWMEVNGKYDGVRPNAYDKYGERIDSLSTDEEDVIVYMDDVDRKNELSFAAEDSSLYYVLIGDGVCPAMPSNVYRLNVMDKLPTAFTPFNKDGLNDYFMKGRKVTIFDRYGQRVFDGNDGWDGTTPGGRVDPGVYFYDVQLNTRSFQGSIEVVYMK